MVWGLPWGAEELILWPNSTIDFLHDFVQVVCVCVLVAQSCPTLRPRELGPSRLLRPWDSPGKVKSLSCVWLFATIWTVACQPPSPGDLPDPGIKSGSSTLQTLLSGPPGKPKNTGLGGHSFLLRVFPAKVLNLVLLLCRQISLPSEPPGKSTSGIQRSCLFVFVFIWKGAYSGGKYHIVMIKHRSHVLFSLQVKQYA